VPGVRRAIVHEFARQEFIESRWDYRPGDHVTFLAPTDWGKTELTNELAEVTASPKLPVINLAMKPRDATMKRWTERLEARQVATWPPGPSWRWAFRKPAAYTLWPRHTFDPDVDDAHLYAQFRSAILDSYKRGKRIINADEVLGLVDLGLMRELRACWTRGRSMGCGVWGSNQAPTFIGRWAYSQAAHLFLGNVPDKAAVDRFGEIGGGIDPLLIRDVTLSLGDHEWLYIRRRGRVMCKILA
jgi:hypothetical protein